MVACLLSYGCQISGKHQNPNRAKSMPGSCFYSVWKVTDRSRCEQAFDAAEEEGDEALATEIRTRRDLFRAGRPFRAE